MTQRYSGQYQVRWTDDKGFKRSKLYVQYKDAQKALKWLTDAGVTDADISVSVSGDIIKLIL